MKSFGAWTRELAETMNKPEVEEVEFVGIPYSYGEFAALPIEGWDGTVECCVCHEYFTVDYEFVEDEDVDHYCGGSSRCCP